MHGPGVRVGERPACLLAVLGREIGGRDAALNSLRLIAPSPLSSHVRKRSTTLPMFWSSHAAIRLNPSAPASGSSSGGGA